jgi:hypothetical protein
MERWAYVAPNKKRDYLMIKYARFFESFKDGSEERSSNPEQEGRTASIALLDQYFRRKQKSKLKEIIKIPMQSTEEGVSSIGF